MPLFRPPLRLQNPLSLICLLWILNVSFISNNHQVWAEEIIVIDPWIIPIDNLPYPTRSAVQGDLVSFHYRGNHNVYVSSSDSQTGGDNNNEPPSSFRCDDTQAAILVGAIGANVANYTLSLSADDSSSSSQMNFTSVTFFCNYTSHCERGQQIQFNIYASRDDIPPTQAPSTMPTMLPTTSVPSIVPTVEVTAPPFVPLFNTTFAPTPGLASQAMRPSPYFRITSWGLSGGELALLSIILMSVYLLQ
mmetsp:Transcript_25723/g.62997  ORF Transcript_25723/g.62997 Transcript_25723/m.62997 type:complete len:248 (+) Transcript_25723:91-834(+)